jgi:hypothetical protein
MTFESFFNSRQKIEPCFKTSARTTRFINHDRRSQKRIQAALAKPQNMGEMAGADSIGTVGNADCGECCGCG